MLPSFPSYFPVVAFTVCVSNSLFNRVIPASHSRRILSLRLRIIIRIQAVRIIVSPAAVYILVPGPPVDGRTVPILLPTVAAFVRLFSPVSNASTSPVFPPLAAGHRDGSVPSPFETDDPADSPGKMGECPSLAHMARTQALQGTASPLYGMPAEGSLSFCKAVSVSSPYVSD